MAILRLNENDFLDQLKREWWELTNECPQEQGTSEKTFLLLQLYVFMLFLSSGDKISLLIDLFFAIIQQQNSLPYISYVN